VDAFGEDFETSENGFVDFLLLDDRSVPFVVLEAKREGKSPLDGKEQARRYARSLKVRFVILSNGNLHYFWDLERGNPEVITEFPTQESILHRKGFTPNNQRLADAEVGEDYIALSQNSHFKEDPSYIDEKTRQDFLSREGIKILRKYQVQDGK
jgi:type I restriction enzyme R subunit